MADVHPHFVISVSSGEGLSKEVNITKGYGTDNLISLDDILALEGPVDTGQNGLECLCGLAHCSRQQQVLCL